MEGYSLDDYIEDVQRSLTPFSVDDGDSVLIKDNLHDATFLIFEFMDLSDQKEKIFRPHVSKRILPTPTEGDRALEVYKKKLIRLNENDFLIDKSLEKRYPEALKHHKGESLTTTHYILTNLLSDYKKTMILPNLGTTALIYQAWKQGRLNEYRHAVDVISNTLYVKEPNRSRNDKSWAKLLLDNIATKLRLLDSTGKTSKVDENRIFKDDSDSWKIKKDDFFFWIELSLIHNITQKNITADYDYYLVHYPLVIDGYWFTGFGYFLKAEEDKRVSKTAEIFDCAKYYKYYKCLHLLNDTFRIPLKNALRNRVLSNKNIIDFRKDITHNILIDVLRACGKITCQIRGCSV
jgi:hypothetical protein